MTHEKNRYGGLVSCHGSSKILQLLGGLEKTPTGKVLFRQIERILGDAEYTQERITSAYASLALVLIDTYRRHIPKSSLLYLELKLVQKRLMPPVSISELASLQAYIKKASKLINGLGAPDEDIIYEALSPLLGYPTPDEKSAPVSETIQQESLLQQPAKNESSSSISIEQHINPDYRHKLDQQRHEMQQLQIDLSEKIDSAKQEYQEFGNLLTTTLNGMQQLTTIDEIVVIRERMVEEMETLLGSQASLADILHETHSLLAIVDNNSQKLNDELDHVRVLSLTDDLTRLPNRRAFIRRLEDEISRSQREHTPLTLALIDLDHFKNINDQHGHNVGDEILQSFANNVLSIFRHYDMVARYGGEEFAVLLPNTSGEGAKRAFTKVRSKAANTRHRNGNTNLAMPSFSAGLAIHKPGEPARNLVERADAALYRAKQSGRDRVEFDENQMDEELVTE